ncbi:MAG: copper resistance protein CopC [Streptomycetaceae bacterium]|nr:MAG: copper resistance protein CopC [Streptomycetaceae bacterium]
MCKKILVLFAAVLLSLSSTSLAFAHGDVVSSSPAADSTLIAAPTKISIEFDGKLQTIGNAQVNSITVTDNHGQIISNPQSVVDGTKISNRLLLTDVTGLVSVHYRIVSEDGHPVEGDYSFRVGETPMLTSAQSEDIAEADAGISEEKGSNLLVNAGGVIIILTLLFFIIKRFKK